jgi:hypothetical protein
MSRAQRLSFLAIAAVVAVIAIVVIASSGGKSDSTANGSTKSALLVPGKVQKLRYTQGDQVRFRVRVPKPDVIHVHGYNIERNVPANRTETIAFKATINGIFDIELHSSDEQIAQLTVEPK